VIEADLFDLVTRDLVNMSDTFSRYVLTDEYRSRLVKLEMIQEI